MRKTKRVAALTAVVLWGLLLLITLITAFINTDTARTLFNGLIFTDIVFPVVIYAMMLVYRFLSHKNDDKSI